MSYPTPNALTLSDISVTMFNVSCLNLVGSIYNFTCDLPTNPDNTAQLPAGIGYPQIHAVGFGYANSSVVENIPLIVSSI